jgi:hypothetical protein
VKEREVEGRQGKDEAVKLALQSVAGFAAPASIRLRRPLKAAL